MIALFESALAEFPPPPPDALLDPQRATADARRSGSRAPTVSALQQEVSLALEALGLSGLRREVDDGGVFQYDFVVDGAVGKGKTKGGVVVGKEGPSSSSSLPLLPVVVEVDGSPHFFVNDLRQPLGDTRFKRRLVRAQVRGSGWGVVVRCWCVYVGDARRSPNNPNQSSHHPLPNTNSGIATPGWSPSPGTTGALPPPPRPPPLPPTCRLETNPRRGWRRCAST